MKKYKHKTNGSTMTFKDGCMRIENLVIEGTPNLEFWEEVIEDEYKVISFKTSCGVVDKQNTLWYSCEEAFYSNRGVSINSVKRLSDGKIFSVGDSVKRHKDKECNSPSKEVHKIKDFYFDKKELQFGTEVERGFILRFFSKVNAPLFTTTDGVEIFEDDVYFVPQYFGDWYEGVLSFEACEKVATDNSKTFSTREKAEEFILFNKPNLSLNEVFSIYPQLKKKEPFVNTDHAERLINLAKSKTK